MKTVILVPRRDGMVDRDAAWAWARARWERYFPDLPIFEGHHTSGPFNRSAAVNKAARLAGDWDLAIVIDSDIFLRVSQVEAALARATETGRVTWAHRRWRGLSQEATARVVADAIDFGAEVDRDDMDPLVEKTNPISWSCCIVIPRAMWDDLGGFDERFVGWGYEDMAFQSAVAGLYGHERIDGDVYHLHHGRAVGNGRPESGPHAITNARLGRRYMVALRRDHGLHDRPGMVASEEERIRDIGNLHHDDEKLAREARRLGLPDWSDWWPTLEELRDGAKAARLGPVAGVTLVVHSGGLAEAWPERRSYLERSIASLAEQVTGPIVKRAIYDCWGDRAIRAWLRERFEPDGFYVVGPDGPVDYTRSMAAMWSYLNSRGQGDYVFAVEDDFTYDRPVDLGPMIDALEANPHLAQIALLRDAYYARERDLGGILGWPRKEFTAVEGRLEHRLFWTMNPMLMRRATTALTWPQAPSSERVFGDLLLRDPRTRFAFWGDGEPWITHIGAVRAGAGY